MMTVVVDRCHGPFGTMRKFCFRPRFRRSLFIAAMNRRVTSGDAGCSRVEQAESQVWFAVAD